MDIYIPFDYIFLPTYDRKYDQAKYTTEYDNTCASSDDNTDGDRNIMDDNQDNNSDYICYQRQVPYQDVHFSILALI